MPDCTEALIDHLHCVYTHQMILATNCPFAIIKHTVSQWSISKSVFFNTILINFLLCVYY